MMAVDRGTVRLGPAGVSADSARLMDVNGDGRQDLVFWFRGSQTGLACGDTSATLVGATTGGVRIVGKDSIEALGCENVRKDF